MAVGNITGDELRDALKKMGMKAREAALILIGKTIPSGMEVGPAPPPDLMVLF